MIDSHREEGAGFPRSGGAPGPPAAGRVRPRRRARARGPGGGPRARRLAATLAGLALSTACGSSPAAPAIDLSSSTLRFYATQGGADPPSETFSVSNAGGGTLAFPNATVRYGSGSGWLVATSSGTSAPYAVTVQPSIGGLAAGSYEATVSVACPGATHSPESVPVTLTVAGPALLGVDGNTIGLWHMNEGAGVTVHDSSGNGYDLLLGGAAAASAQDPSWDTACGVRATCLAFDGSQSQYVSGSFSALVPYPTNAVSVELLFASSDPTGVLFGTGFIDTAVQWSGYELFFAVGDGANWSSCPLDPDTSAALSDGSWHYLATTFDGAESTIYADGQAVGSCSASPTLAAFADVFVGGRPGETFVTGLMSEVRLSSVARSAAEISSFYEALAAGGF